MQKLALPLRVETIDKDEQVLTAEQFLKLKVQELGRAQKAVEEADRRLNLAVIEALKSKPLKWHEGELVQVLDVNRLYCFANDEFMNISPSERTLYEVYEKLTKTS